MSNCVVKNIISGVWGDIVVLWKQDVSGYTLSEYSSFPSWRLRHPFLASILNYGMAVLRILLYWIATGLVGIVGPIFACIEIGIHWRAIVHYGASGMVGITLFVVLVVLLEALWVIPYFVSKSK